MARAVSSLYDFEAEGIVLGYSKETA